LRRDLPRTRKLALKKVQITGFGEPEDVAECVECPEVGEPAADEVIFDVVAFPINPADIAFCRGRYRLKPPLPATPGAEGAGRVVSVGEAVTGVKPGNLIIHLDRENWAQRRRVKADRVVVLPHGTDVLQAAMIRINPPTAMLLLSEFVTDLRPQDWIIQNVANSAVGRLVTLFARERNLHTISVVRRDHVFSELYDLGADACVVDGPRPRGVGRRLHQRRSDQARHRRGCRKRHGANRLVCRGWGDGVHLWCDVRRGYRGAGA